MASVGRSPYKVSALSTSLVDLSMASAYASSPSLVGVGRDPRTIDAEMGGLQQRCKSLERQCAKMHGALEKGQVACERWRRRCLSATPSRSELRESSGPE